jgi:hypothetical protein
LLIADRRLLIWNTDYPASIINQQSPMRRAVLEDAARTANSRVRFFNASVFNHQSSIINHQFLVGFPEMARA